MTVIHAVFPWRFPLQTCTECELPLDIEAAIPVVTVEGTLIGFVHDPECGHEA